MNRIGPQTLVFWWILLNGLVAGLWALVSVRLAPSRERSAFTMFLLAYGLWANGLFAVQLVGASHQLSRIISQMIFFAGAMFIGHFGRFLITFAAPRELTRWYYKLLFWSVMLAGTLSFSGLVEDGVVFDPNYGLAPKAGRFLSLYNGALLLFGLYYFATTAFAYWRASGRLLRSQLRTLILSGVPSFLIIIMTNIIIPGTTGNYSLTPIGGLWLFIFLAGVAHIVSTGRLLVVYDGLRELVGLSLVKDSDRDDWEPLKEIEDTLDRLERLKGLEYRTIRQGRAEGER